MELIDVKHSRLILGERRIRSVSGFSREEPKNPEKPEIQERFGENLFWNNDASLIREGFFLFEPSLTTQLILGWIEMIKVETNGGVWGPFGDSGTYSMDGTNW